MRNEEKSAMKSWSRTASRIVRSLNRPAELLFRNDGEMSRFHREPPQDEVEVIETVDHHGHASPGTNQPLPPSFREQATISTPAKCSRSGIQSTPSERKRMLPKTDSVIWASVTKRSSFSPTRNPSRGCSTGKRDRFLHVKNAASRAIDRVDADPFCDLLDECCKHQEQDERVRHGQVEEEHEAHQLHHEDERDRESASGGRARGTAVSAIGFRRGTPASG